jgi:hypothetical protein
VNAFINPVLSVVTVRGVTLTQTKGDAAAIDSILFDAHESSEKPSQPTSL